MIIVFNTNRKPDQDIIDKVMEDMKNAHAGEEISTVTHGNKDYKRFEHLGLIPNMCACEKIDLTRTKKNSFSLTSDIYI